MLHTLPVVAQKDSLTSDAALRMDLLMTSVSVIDTVLFFSSKYAGQVCEQPNDTQTVRQSIVCKTMHMI